MEELQKICQPLYGFVYKYFDKLTPEEMADIKYDFILSPVELFQLIRQAHALFPDLRKAVSIEDEVMDFWAHQELILKALVVLTKIPLMYVPLQSSGELPEAVQIRDELIDVFTNKAIEDPNVLQAIHDGTIDAEIEKRRISQDLFNFKPLFEIKKTWVVDPLGIDFQDIPDKF